MVIKITDYVSHCHTDDDGKKILEIIKPLLYNGEHVSISFNGIDSVTSSFVNSALIELLEYHSFDYIKSNMTFKNTNREINKIIKKRFDFEVIQRPKMEKAIIEEQ